MKLKHYISTLLLIYVLLLCGCSNSQTAIIDYPDSPKYEAEAKINKDFGSNPFSELTSAEEKKIIETIPDELRDINKLISLAQRPSYLKIVSEYYNLYKSHHYLPLKYAFNSDGDITFTFLLIQDGEYEKSAFSNKHVFKRYLGKATLIYNTEDKKWNKRYDLTIHKIKQDDLFDDEAEDYEYDKEEILTFLRDECHIKKAEKYLKVAVETPIDPIFVDDKKWILEENVKSVDSLGLDPKYFSDDNWNFKENIGGDMFTTSHSHSKVVSDPWLDDFGFVRVAYTYIYDATGIGSNPDGTPKVYREVRTNEYTLDPANPDEGWTKTNRRVSAGVKNGYEKLELKRFNIVSKLSDWQTYLDEAYERPFHERFFKK